MASNLVQLYLDLCCDHENNDDCGAKITSVIQFCMECLKARSSECQIQIIKLCEGDALYPKISVCELPCFVSTTGCIHSGLTACVRQLVLYFATRCPDIISLLGYHQNCFRACAEVSPWTYFCEKTLQGSISEAEMSQAAKMLEKHLHSEKNAPSRKSCDIKKSLSNEIFCPLMDGDMDILSDQVSNLRIHRPNAVHRFMEGNELTIIDMIILPFIHKLPDGLLCQFPLLLKWYTMMLTIPAVKIAFNKTVCDLVGQRRVKLSILPQESRILCATVTSIGDSIKRESMRGCKKTVDASPLLEEQLSAITPEQTNPAFISGPQINWDTMPEAIHPKAGDLPRKRVTRKCQQLDSLIRAVLAFVRPGDRIVEFCSGGGHLGIALAYLLPDCEVIMIENKEESLMSAVKRAQAQGLKNVTFYQTNLTHYRGVFDVGVSLHACGSVTDLVLDRCVSVGAAFVVCPCCYGAINPSAAITYPRSDTYSRALSSKDYLLLSRAADQTEFTCALAEHGKRCMNHVDWDRGLLARQRGYTTVLTTLVPLECTPKHNVLIGLPPERALAT